MYEGAGLQADGTGNTRYFRDMLCAYPKKKLCHHTIFIAIFNFSFQLLAMTPIA